MKKTIFHFILIIAFFSGTVKSQINTIDLLASAKSELTAISEIASDVNYIPLQTNQNCLIKYIYDFKSCNNKLYVFTLSSILCFDKDGKYLYKLDEQGRGPKEYTFINDWDLSPANNLLIILIKSKILIYKITNEGFVYSNLIDLKDQPQSIDFGPDQKSVLLSYGSSAGNEPFRNVLINLTGEILKTIPNSYKYSKKTKMMFYSKFENIQFRLNNSLCFKFWLSDTVFALNKSGRIFPYLKFDSHGKQCTQEALANFNSETLSKYLSVTNISETQRYLTYNYSYENSSKYTVYDKVTKNQLSINVNSSKETKWILDDISGGVNLEPKFCSDGNFYSWINALALKQYVASDVFKNATIKNPYKKKTIQTLANSLDESDNPVLIIITLKK